MRFLPLAATAVAVLALGTAVAQPQTVLYPSLTGSPLLDAILADYVPPTTLEYDIARDSLYAYEQRTDGMVCGVYTQFCITLAPGADPSTSAFNQGINAEHTWPQSRGAAAEPRRGDLHALYPAKSNVNSSRSNHPYGEIPDGDTDTWYRDNDRQSSIPSVSAGEWSERQNTHPDRAWRGRFEPRHDHKGNAARAVFYFRAVYPAAVAAAGSQPFFDVMEDDLIVWHYADPVDLEEYARSAWIASLQGTPNPFVLDSTLARRAYRLSGVPRTEVWVNEIHYDNDGADRDEGVEIAGTAGLDLDGWTVALYTGSDGTVYDAIPLSGTIDDEKDGLGALWFDRSGIQNGSPDGLALVDAAGRVVEFWSYNGTFTASAGPASGQVSTDLGVSETASQDPDMTLQRVGTGGRADDFAWAVPTRHSRGSVNRDQTFVNTGARQVSTQEAVSALAEVTLYPNPTRGRTTLALQLDAPSEVSVSVYDMLGRQVTGAGGGFLGVGFQSVDLDLGTVPAGIYLVRIVAGASVSTHPVTVVR